MRAVGPGAPATARPWRVFVATSIGVVAVFLNISGLSVALPTIARELGADAAQANWILLSYLLVTTALILVFGRLADIIGRHRLYLAGLALFTLATGLCALSVSPQMLIVARILQGMGAAACVTNNTALLTDTFPAADLGRALGWNVTIAATAQVAGPVVGGAATALLGWRGLFLVCAPIGLLALVMSLLFIPRPDRTRRRRERFDLAGAALSTLALTATVLALTTTAEADPRLVRVCGIAAVALLVVFVVVQRRREHPLIDVGLFRLPTIAVAMTAVIANAVATNAVVVLVSLYGQAGGLTPVRAGVMVAPVALGTVVAAALTAALTTRYSPRILTATGMAASLIGLVGLAATMTDDANSLWAVTPFLFVIGAGNGLFMTPSTNALMLAAPTARRGIANGLRSTSQNLGTLVSSALALALGTAGLSESARRAAIDGTLGAIGPVDLAHFVANLRTATAVFAAVAALGIALCWFLPARRPNLDAVADGAVTDDSADRASGERAHNIR